MQTKAKRDWEPLFGSWGQPPSKSEQERCDHAVSAVQKAISASERLSSRDVIVTPQGSYLNNTNVKVDSDVDLSVRCRSKFLNTYLDGIRKEDVGMSDGDYSFQEYKSDIEEALINHFGLSAVNRGNKAFDIGENSYRVEADAAPCMIHRRYFRSIDGKIRYHEGLALVSDEDGKSRTSFPDQQKTNGISKNKATRMRFKRVVRIAKRLRNELSFVERFEIGDTPSFLIESLVWNVDDHIFLDDSLKQVVLNVLAEIYEATRNGAAAVHWREANGIKLLFSEQNDWTMEQANKYARITWNYVND